jgi:hypothetical protein
MIESADFVLTPAFLRHFAEQEHDEISELYFDAGLCRILL